MKKSLWVVLVVVCVAVVTSCKGYDSALKAYNLGEYEKAAKLFEGVQKGEENKSRRAEECFYIGECYRRLGRVGKAASAYQRAVKMRYEDDIALLRLADCYRALGKFDEANAAYDLYAEKHRTDLRVGVGRESAKMARGQWSEISGKGKGVDSGYVVKPFTELNSKYSDFCPSFVGDGYDVVYFSSMRFQKKKKKANRITGQGNSALYMSRVDARGKWTEPEPMEEPFGGKGNDDGVAYVSDDGRTMLFTRCPLTGSEGNAAQAYEVKREGGRWSDPVRITPGGDSTMMVAHPTLSPDGQVLYFVSDREEGSVGGLDIWKSLRNVGGTWGPAQNMGAIVNSKGDEMFPYVRHDGTLYFSSNGHKGYGGLDIYKAIEREDGRYEVVNMGVPINSAGDDFGIAFMGNAEEGLLSSNRGNGKGYDDIYSFCLPPVVLSVEVRVGDSGKRAFDKAGVSENREGSVEQGEKVNGGDKKVDTGKKKQQAQGKKQQSGKKQQGTKKTQGTKSGAGKNQGTKSQGTKAGKKKQFKAVEGAFVRVVGSDGTNEKLKCGADGKVSFVADKDVRYIMLCGGAGYANKRVEVSTEGLNRSQTLEVEALLERVGE